SDVQWRRLTALPKFAPVASEARQTNEGRQAGREQLRRDMVAVTMQHTVDELLADLAAATIPATRIHDIRQARDLPALHHKLTRTTLLDGRTLRMQPMAVDVAGALGALGFAPKYGQHTRQVLAEAGLSTAAIQELAGAGVIA
ncbi:MAG TPA: CoA transferase, partial [Ramlibacter sp.]